MGCLGKGPSQDSGISDRFTRCGWQGALACKDVQHAQESLDLARHLALRDKARAGSILWSTPTARHGACRIHRAL